LPIPSCDANRWPDEGADQHDDADDESPSESCLPGEQRVVGSQINRQHDHENDDEHVRHARTIRHGRHVAAFLGLGQTVGEIGIVEIAERKRDAQRRQDMAEDDVAR
jgi:hypothetical protein